MPGLAAFLLLAASALTPATARNDIDPVVARLAAEIEAQAGLPPAGQIRITGARGERRTLILSIDLRADTSDLFRPPQVASSIAAGLCAVPGRRNFFSDGRVLRVEVTRAGRAEGSGTVDRCPGPVGQGLSAATFAASMQVMVGVETHGMTIAAVRAEGNAVIVTLAFPAGAVLTDATQAFMEGFCEHPEELGVFFGNGVVLRVETRIGDRDPVAGPLVTACPAR